MLFSQFDASEHAPLVSRVTADTNHRVNEMSRISGNELANYLSVCTIPLFHITMLLRAMECESPLRFGKYPPLATSTSVNSCYLLYLSDSTRAVIG